MLRSRSPLCAPPRLTGSTVLLTGLARCGKCGSAMMRCTGKSGAYTYYKCGAVLPKGLCLVGKPLTI